MKRHAFTLVELLVAIGMVALLVSLLAPGLNRAWDVLKATMCRENLRRIHEAFKLHKADAIARRTDQWPFFPEADAWPMIPYEILTEGQNMFICPATDDQLGESDMGIRNPLSRLVYRNIDSSPWKPARNIEICFADPAHQGWGNMHLGTEPGVDERGPYIDIRLDDNSIVNAKSDGHDGWLRLWENVGGKTIIKLMKYSCGEYNAVLFDGQPLFTKASDPAGVTDPNSQQYGWLGPGTSKNGMEVELGQKSMTCSYGMTLGCENFRPGSHKILVADYVERILDPTESEVQDKMQEAARHLGQMNVLFSDGSVDSFTPMEIDPLLATNGLLWKP
jgi:prepilin-type N-terminal cleavage/methylation domain-containing protein/prepilin-type processing-associated H-X9-DG protein